MDIRAQRVKTHSNPCLFGDELIIIIIIIIIIIKIIIINVFISPVKIHNKRYRE